MGVSGVDSPGGMGVDSTDSPGVMGVTTISVGGSGVDSSWVELCWINAGCASLAWEAKQSSEGVFGINKASEESVHVGGSHWFDIRAIGLAD